MNCQREMFGLGYVDSQFRVLPTALLDFVSSSGTQLQATKFGNSSCHAEKGLPWL